MSAPRGLLKFLFKKNLSGYLPIFVFLNIHPPIHLTPSKCFFSLPTPSIFPIHRVWLPLVIEPTFTIPIFPCCFFYHPCCNFLPCSCIYDCSRNWTASDAGKTSSFITWFTGWPHKQGYQHSWGGRELPYKGLQLATVHCTLNFDLSLTPIFQSQPPLLTCKTSLQALLLFLVEDRTEKEKKPRRHIMLNNWKGIEMRMNIWCPGKRKFCVLHPYLNTFPEKPKQSLARRTNQEHN